MDSRESATAATVLGLTLVGCAAAGAGAVGASVVDFTDLGVYRAAVTTWWQGLSPYAVEFADGLRFNYPPSSLVLLAPLDIAPRTFTGLLLIAVGGVLLTMVCRWCLPGIPWPKTAVIAGVLAFSEPVQTAWAYGQVDLIVLAAIVGALVRAQPRAPATAVGFAAGLKLLPTMFLLVPVAQRRWRLVTASAATVATLVAVSLIRTPSMLGDYAAQLGQGAVLVRPVDRNRNESWRGLLERAVGQEHATLAWLVISVVLGFLALAGAVVAARRHDALSAIALVALVGLLLSPVAWTHHWVWAPVVLGTVVPAWRSGRAVDRSYVAAALALTTATILWLPAWFATADHSLDVSGLRWIASYSYVLLGTITLMTLSLRVLSASPEPAPAADDSDTAVT